MEVGGYPGKAKDLGDGGDILILAGDITNVRFFHKDVTRSHKEAWSGRKHFENLEKHWFPRFKTVLYVLGNHEYYGYFIDEGVQVMRDYLAGTNVQILENQSVKIDDILFVGATLWTNFNNQDPHEMDAAKWNMADYRNIARKRYETITYVERNNPDPFVSSGNLLPNLIYDRHIHSRGYIEQTLTNNKNTRTVVITHHAPSLKCNDTQRHGTFLMYSFASNMEGMIDRHDQVELWVCGHTHYNHDFVVGNTRLISNQRGYAGHESIASEFKPIFVEI